MPTPPKNRIEVDLKLMSDKDTKLIKELVGEIKTLNSKLVFGTVAQQMTGAANVVNAGQAPYLSSQEWKQQHATTDPGKHSRNVASNYDEVVKASRLQRMAGETAYSPYHKLDNKDFLNLSRFTDFTSQDVLKQISYALGKFGFQDGGKDPITGQQREPDVTNPNFARGSRAFGLAAHSYPYYHGVKKMSTQIRNHITGNVSYGLSVGQPGAGSGLFGTPMLSPAYRTGLATSFNKFKQTWGGWNPNYSGSQFDEAAQATASYGYDTGSDRGQFFQGQVAKLQRGLGISGAEASSMLDPSMRFGTNSLTSLSDSLVMMGRAAGQAGVNTQQLTLAAQQYGDQLAQSFGGFGFQRQQQVGGLGTIFSSPQVGGALANDNTLNNMIVAQKGSYFKAAFSKTHAQDSMHALQTYMAPFGGNFDKMGNILKHGSAAQKDALMSNLTAAQQQGMIPGGMTAIQFATQLMRGGNNLMKSAQATDLLSLAGNQANHLSNSQLRTLEKDVAGKHWKEFAAEHTGNSASDRKSRYQAIADLFGQNQRKATGRAGTRVRISLDPTAAKYLKASVDQQNGLSSDKNSKGVGYYANKAMGDIESYGPTILEHLL